MSINPSFILNGSGGVEMLACRQRTDRPADRHKWGGVVPESILDTDRVHRAIKDYGLVAVELFRLASGGVATLLEDTEGINQLHNRFSYTVRVAPHVGADLIDPETIQCLPPELSLASNSTLNCLDANKWSVCVIKPDAKQLGMERKIFTEIEARGIVVAQNISNVALTMQHLDQLWPAPYDEFDAPCEPSPWWASTINYMLASPVDVLLVTGDNVSTQLKQIKTDLRAQVYGPNYQSDESLSFDERVKSVIHTSDCNKELITNAAAFWTSDQIQQITRTAA